MLQTSIVYVILNIIHPWLGPMKALWIAEKFCSILSLVLTVFCCAETESWLKIPSVVVKEIFTYMLIIEAICIFMPCSNRTPRALNLYIL